VETSPNSQTDSLSRQGSRVFVPFAGGEVSWRQFGSGQPLVLLHGGHGSWRHWAKNILPLANEHCVWVPDMPGYGDSSNPVEPTLASVVSALKESLEALIGKDAAVNLMGFSFGALVAAHLAFELKSVPKLALIGAAGHGGARRPSSTLQPWRDIPLNDSNALVKVMQHNLAALMLHSPQSVDAMALDIHMQACLKTKFYSKHISRATGLADALLKHQGSQLLLWGEHDVTAHPVEHMKSMPVDRTRCQLSLVPGAGHWAQYEQAAWINTHVLDWLRT
jgi:pimeloyl-ACP methyl ester carboxylesterase